MYQGPTSQTSGHMPDGHQQHPVLSWPCRNLQAGGKGRECILKRLVNSGILVKMKTLEGPVARVSRVRECLPQRGHLSMAMNDFSSCWPPSLLSQTPQGDGHCGAAGKKLFPCTRHSRDLLWGPHRAVNAGLRHAPASLGANPRGPRSVLQRGLRPFYLPNYK